MQTCSSNKSSNLQSNGNVKLGLVKFFILYHKHKESLDFGVQVAVVPDLLFNLFIHLWVQVVLMIGFRVSFDELMVHDLP